MDGKKEFKQSTWEEIGPKAVKLNKSIKQSRKLNVVWVQNETVVSCQKGIFTNCHNTDDSGRHTM